MFDAKSILDALVRGGAPADPPRAAQGAGSADHILSELGRMLGPQAGAGGEQGGGGLADILRQMVPQEPAGRSHAQGEPAPGGSAGAGGLGEILGRLQEQLGGGAGSQQGGASGQGGHAGGSLMDILGQVLGQATQGVKEGAQRVDDATGASGHMRDAVGKATGQSPDELLAQLKDLIAKNQLGVGAAAGGLGAVLLGTRTGRSITGKALKIGGLALIGGLAYKALQNYQAGRPLVGGGQDGDVARAPAGTGFEPAAVTNDAATLYIRAMIAAAAADGRLDDAEQQKILGNLKQAGLERGAEDFLAAELNSPATVIDLARSVNSEQEAIQLYTAARIAIDLDAQEEHDFLAALARELALDGNLVAHIDATARATG